MNFHLGVLAVNEPREIKHLGTSGGRDKMINLIGSLIASAIIFLIRDNYLLFSSCHMTGHFLLHQLMRYVIGALRRKRMYTASHEPQMNDHKHSTLALTLY